MLRGEIRLVDLDVGGSEANKRRPAVIVSNDRANSTAARLGRGAVTVVPVTSNNTDRIFPFQTFLPAAATGLRQDAKAQAEQVRSIAVERLGAVLGRASADVMAHLDDAFAPPPATVGTGLQIVIRPWNGQCYDDTMVQ